MEQTTQTASPPMPSPAPRPRPQPRTEINWGGVIKGVAIVAAVAVVAVGAAYLASAAVGSVGTATAGSELATAVGQNLMNGWDAVASGVTNFWNNTLVPDFKIFINNLTAWLTPEGGTAAFKAAASSSGALANSAGLIAGGTAVAVAAPIATHALSATNLVHHHTPGLHEAAHVAAHTSTERHPAAPTTRSTKWTDIFTSKADGPKATNFAPAGTRPTDLTPRDGDFAKLVEDRRKLSEMLNNKGGVA